MDADAVDDVNDIRRQHVSSVSYDKVSQELRDTSLRMFDLLNHGKVEDSIFQLLAPDYHQRCENTQGPYTAAVTREEFLQHYLQLLEDNPSYYLNATECSVQMSDHNRRATVMLSGDTSVGAHPTSMRIEVVNVLYWERRKHNGWVCCRGKCIRGPAGDGMRGCGLSGWQ